VELLQTAEVDLIALRVDDADAPVEDVALPLLLDLLKRPWRDASQIEQARGQHGGQGDFGMLHGWCFGEPPLTLQG
jgi:hypothetical protein